MGARDRTGLLWVTLLILSAGVWAAVDPAGLASAARKEGPVEWVSELVLGCAALGWMVWGRDDRPRWVSVAVSVGCVVVLGEELDWGGVVRVEAAASWLESAAGHPNLHNAGGGASYLLFALPWLALYGAAAARWGAQAGVPPRSDALAAAITGGAAIASVAVSEGAEAVVDELTELALYGLLWIGAWRRRSPRGGSGGEQLEGHQTPGPARALSGAVDRADAGPA